MGQGDTEYQETTEESEEEEMIELNIESADHTGLDKGIPECQFCKKNTLCIVRYHPIEGYIEYCACSACHEKETFIAAQYILAKAVAEIGLINGAHSKKIIDILTENGIFERKKK